MNYKDYKQLKHGKKFTVGKFTDNIFALETKSGYGCVPEYHKISQAEFNTFDIWKDDRAKTKEVIARPVFCSGYEGETDFDEKKV